MPTRQSLSTQAFFRMVLVAGLLTSGSLGSMLHAQPDAKVKRPERELKGSEKVRLAPGETKHITLKLDAQAFSSWDEAKKSWKMDAGKFAIHAGDSSESTPPEDRLSAVE